MALYHRPTELDEALDVLAAGAPVVLAGGTDFYPARVGPGVGEDVLDITGIGGLRGIRDTGEALEIGALTTWTDVLEARRPAWLDGLAQAAREVGGVQIQNTGTIGGNLCNASPAADGIVALLALDAEVRLISVAGERRLPLAEFVTGNRRTARRPDELASAILIPKPRHDARAVFLKLGAREYLVISIVMVAAVLERGADGRVAAARIAVGACSPVARRLARLEAALVGEAVSPALGDLVTARHLEGLDPIDDVRGTAGYRDDAALTLTARALRHLGGAW